MLFIPKPYSSQNEIRGIWFHALGDSEVLPNNYTLASIKLFNDFKLYTSPRYKIHDVFVLTVDTEYAIYNTNISGLNRCFDFDALSLICQTAQQFNINVHTWIALRTNKPEWQTKGINNNTSIIGNFAIPEFRQFILSIINEIIENYPVKGIHLDYIRYAGKDYSYDDYSTKTFQSLYGFDPRTDPDNPLWKQWRETQITTMVNETYITIKSHSLDLKLSCAVIPKPEDCLQNWFYWSQIPIVDFLTPMTYEIDGDSFKADAEYIRQNADPRTPILMGIGIWQINGSTVLEQIGITRQYNFAGFVFFRDKWLLRVPPIPDPPTYWYDDPKMFAIVIVLCFAGILIFREFYKQWGNKPNSQR
jgi:uncharacterized lipoprotein YddW (UPF0748 family)